MGARVMGDKVLERMFAGQDDDPEAFNAFLAIRRRYRDKKVMLVCTDKDYVNPLLFVVEQQGERIEKLEGEVEALKSRMKRIHQIAREK